MGRKKMWEERMVAAFPEGTFALIDKVSGGQDRTQYVRSLVFADICRCGLSAPLDNILSQCLVDAIEQQKLRKKAHAGRAG